MNVDEITSCLEVSDEHIAWALAPSTEDTGLTSPERAVALLERMAAVAAPGRGAPKILIVLAHVAKCRWVRAELVVLLRADGDATGLEVILDDGVRPGRLLGPLRIGAPFSEFARALELRPEIILPLRSFGQVGDVAAMLRTTAALRRDSIPPSVAAGDALPDDPGPAGGEAPAVVDVLPRPPAAAPPERPGDPGEALRPRYRALSLPRHLKAALAPHRKKPGKG